jgi:hypothetical protein
MGMENNQQKYIYLTENMRMEKKPMENCDGT